MEARSLITDKTLQVGILNETLRLAIAQNVSSALAEDKADNDASAQLIDSGQRGQAQIISRDSAIIAGCFWVEECFKRMDSHILMHWNVSDGDSVQSQQKVCDLQGSLRAILSAERSALNFLQTLSSTATRAAALANALGQTTLLLDTRKTIPGLRVAQKYAVACGGGYNHRLDLSQMVLIKDNHIKACGSIGKAVAAARAQFPNLPIEVETETLSEVKAACDAAPDLIMLDNFSTADITQALQTIDGRYLTEVSGGVDLQNISQIAEIGVDFVSVGDMTKNIQAVDLTLKII